MNKVDIHQEIEIEVISGVEGPCISIDCFRVAGPKPWGGGKVIHKWTATIEDILDAIPNLKEALK
jgi:hypothetical protein